MYVVWIDGQDVAAYEDRAEAYEHLAEEGHRDCLACRLTYPCCQNGDVKHCCRVEEEEYTADDYDPDEVRVELTPRGRLVVYFTHLAARFDELGTFRQAHLLAKLADLAEVTAR